jgi:phage-related tail fiber protein
MIDANSQFFAILTNVGMAKQANADALGIPWLITQMGVGDANPNGLADPPNPVPAAGQTKLLSEWRRKPLNQLKIDPVNPAVIIAEQIIPADEGGKWIREIGLYDADGDLVAVANCAPSFKPLLSQGSGRTQIVRMNFIVTSTGNIQLKIDPAIVLASRAYVDAAILEVLPKNKTPGQWTRVKTNDRGIVVSGDNPETLAGMGIKDTYTKTEIEAMIAQASALPVGATVAFPLNKVAPGFLELDGSVKSIAVYPDLAAFLGTAFNKGDEGAGNFRLPESRGEFLRGWDHGRGVDAGREVGSSQLDALQNITGSLNARAANVSGSGTLIVGNASGAFVGAEKAGGSAGTMALATTGTVNNGVDVYTLDASRVARTSTETRGRNLAVVWCIKAWNAPINQGNIDIAALAALATQATEIKLGTAKIATQAQANAGTDDATIITPKKLRFGFSISWGASDCIVFPTILGGIIIQWISSNTGQISQGSAEVVTAPWLMEFPNACWYAQGSTGKSQNGNGFASCRVDGYTANSVTSSTFAHITGWVMRKIFGIGY